jgi:hypothetical protein
MLDRILSGGDEDLALPALQKLARHDTGRWALTGGLATEIHCLLRGRAHSRRVFNDIDFVVDSFDGLPESLTEDFLFRHIHPADPPGKILLQCIDPDSAVRIDVFRAFGATMSRISRLDLAAGTFGLISVEDLAARAARLVLDLTAGVPTASKYAADYLRLAALVDAGKVETAWRDQRKPGQPDTFAEADLVLQEAIPANQHLLTTTGPWKDDNEACGRCLSTGAFRLSESPVPAPARRRPPERCT